MWLFQLCGGLIGAGEGYAAGVVLIGLPPGTIAPALLKDMKQVRVRYRAEVRNIPLLAFIRFILGARVLGWRLLNRCWVRVCC